MDMEKVVQAEHIKQNCLRNHLKLVVLQQVTPLTPLHVVNYFFTSQVNPIVEVTTPEHIVVSP